MTSDPKIINKVINLLRVREIFLKREIISWNDRKVAVVYGWEKTPSESEPSSVTGKRRGSS